MTVLQRRGGWAPIELDREASDLLDRLADERPDVVLLDIGPSAERAMEVTRALGQLEGPAVRVLVLAPREEQQAVTAAIQAGAAGCVLDDCTVDELTAAAQAVYRGENYCSPQMVHYLFARLSARPGEEHWSDRASVARLTLRELEILQLVAAGHSNKRIARHLSVSIYTVKNHVHRILTKLQAEDRHEAVHRARRSCLLDP